MMSETSPRKTPASATKNCGSLLYRTSVRRPWSTRRSSTWATWVAKLWPWMPSGLLRKFRALSIASPNRARQATSRSWTSDGIRTSATSSKTSGATVRSPTSVVPARGPSITWRLRSRVKTSESKRGLVMTSVRRSSTLSRTPGSATALARWRISSLNRNFSSWSSMGAMVAPASGPSIRRNRTAPAGDRGRSSSSGERLWIEAAHLGRIGDSLNGKQVRRRPHVDLVPLGDGQGLAERLDHDLLELGVHDLLAPVVAVQVLDPLEVADGHATRIAQDVRDHERAVLEEGDVGLGRRRAIRRLGDEPRLDVSGVAGRDLVLEGGRDEDVAVDLEDLLVVDVGRAGQALDRAMLLLPGDHPADVETGGIVDATGRVGHGDDGRALLGDELRGDRAGVAEALDRDPRLRQLDPEMAGCLDDAIDGATGGRLVATLRPAEADRLAGHDARDRVADVHRVGVHHPRHDLGVRVDVRGRDVLLGANEDLDLGEEATGQGLELLLAELLRIDDDATLAAAVRDPDDRALPGHPHRQRLDLVEADVLVIANAALGRTAAQVVLDPITRIDLDGAVVHLHGEVDDQLAAWLAQDAAQAGVEIESLGGEVELLLGDLPGVDCGSDLLGRHDRWWTSVRCRGSGSEPDRKST